MNLLKRYAWIGKIIFATSLLWWLFSSDRLSIEQLGIYWREPEVGVFTFGFWVICAVFLVSLRWQKLLQAFKITVGYVAVLRLNLIGLFFNTIIPGAVSGDLLKVYYVCRGNKNNSKFLALLSVLFDRIVGLYGAFSAASLVIAWTVIFRVQVQLDSNTLSLAAIVVGLWLVLTCIAAAVLSSRGVRVINFLHLKFNKYKRLIAVINKLVVARQHLRDQKKEVILALLIGSVLQIAQISFFAYLTVKLTNIQSEFFYTALVYPLGITLTALPIAPGGLGVGHVAFDQLFHYVGVNGGANIFNVFFVGQFICNLLGVFAYLSVSKKEFSGVKTPVEVHS